MEHISSIVNALLHFKNKKKKGKKSNIAKTVVIQFYLLRALVSKSILMFKTNTHDGIHSYVYVCVLFA